jgi:cystathionine gamma-lyase
LEKCLAPLENAKYALTFSSGLGATTTLTFLLKSGDHILAVDDVYGGTNRLLRQCSSKMGIEASFVNMRDLKELENGIKPNTTVSFIIFFTS